MNRELRVEVSRSEAGAIRYPNPAHTLHVLLGALMLRSREWGLRPDL